MSLEKIMDINVLMKTTELIQHGYRVVDYTKEGIMFDNDKMPNMRYLGHFVDDFKKYIRLTDKYRIKE
jgi:hypothetical protein